jgi:hypothetical protein
MTPIALTDVQMHEVRQAARTVPIDLRALYLERVAVLLRDKTLGDGEVFRICRGVAQQIIWDTTKPVA